MAYANLQNGTRDRGRLEMGFSCLYYRVIKISFGTFHAYRLVTSSRGSQQSNGSRMFITTTPRSPTTAENKLALLSEALRLACDNCNHSTSACVIERRIIRIDSHWHKNIVPTISSIFVFKDKIALHEGINCVSL